jgi:hypothetical protein
MLLMREQRRDSNAVFFVGDIAKKMGLKSSTYLKNICKHLVSLEIGVYMISTERGDYFGYEPPRQMEFFDRSIKINGQSIACSTYYEVLQSRGL